MNSRLASAPCTWGVWERTVGRDDLIPPERMLDAVRGLGYQGIELGPPGYLGAAAGDVADTLARHGLELVGAFAPLHIADEEAFRADLAFLDQTIETLAASGSRGPVVLAADENDVRLAVAGRVLERVRSRELSVEEAWEQGLFCAFGEGAVDFAAVLAELGDYEGWLVIEQDRVAVRLDDLESVRMVEVRNLEVVGRATAD